MQINKYHAKKVGEHISGYLASSALKFLYVFFTDFVAIFTKIKLNALEIQFSPLMYGRQEMNKISL